MDGEISIPRNLQTDRVVAAAPKRGGRSSNPRRFEMELAREKKPSEDPKQENAEAEADEPADGRDDEAQAEAADVAGADDGNGVLDFEA